MELYKTKQNLNNYEVMVTVKEITLKYTFVLIPSFKGKIKFYKKGIFLEHFDRVTKKYYFYFLL